MIVQAAKVAASGVILILASQCARNMIQTARIAASASSSASPTPLPENSLPSITLDTVDVDDSKDTADCMDDPPRAVRYLQSLTRPQLLELFASSTPPHDLSVLNGEWNGLLLDNNGKIMTAVSNIMTHRLFGGGMRWNGKQFSSYRAKNGGNGVNRFVTATDSSTTTTTTEQSISPKKIVEKRHEFDYEIQDSKLYPGSQSIRLRYDHHHVRLSPWHTMNDELRLVRVGEMDALVGMGCMAWSGGMLNAAPFCLWRAEPNL
jgi:hypothetical protein